MIQTTTAQLVMSKFLRRKEARSRGGIFSSDRETLLYKNQITIAQWKGDSIILANRSVIESIKQYQNIHILISFAKIRRIPLYVARKGVTISPTITPKYYTKYTKKYFSLHKNCGSRTAEFYRGKREKEMGS